MFYGYCFPKSGGDWHTPKINLKTAEDVFRYTQLQGRIFGEVRVTDESDFTVVQMVNGKYTFPEEWKVFNKQ